MPAGDLLQRLDREKNSKLLFDCLEQKDAPVALLFKLTLDTFFREPSAVLMLTVQTRQLSTVLMLRLRTSGLCKALDLRIYTNELSRVLNGRKWIPESCPMFYNTPWGLKSTALMERRCQGLLGGSCHANSSHQGRNILAGLHYSNTVPPRQNGGMLGTACNLLTGRLRLPSWNAPPERPTNPIILRGRGVSVAPLNHITVTLIEADRPAEP
ncbi:hypothetical protein EYF80_029003 [Liparis tanakae]|uniref:Uncharacterized protein n=1 Tax=Liparis tanakae TaxID=230148 RepID=A0A4Z2H4S3_9TELE|nr:hypothetical protein EYF80_029003 [Liparis tanakae]